MKLNNYYHSLPKPDKKHFLESISKKCGVTIWAARHYVYGIRRVSPKYCKIISSLTKNKVKNSDLRPDIF